jgi:hypothetical protein
MTSENHTHSHQDFFYEKLTHLTIGFVGTTTLIKSVAGVRCIFPSKLAFFIVVTDDLHKKKEILFF